jgi:hypothetical protein
LLKNYFDDQRKSIVTTPVQTPSVSPTLTAQLLVEQMNDAEKHRATCIEQVLPVLRQFAVEADTSGEFYVPHVQTLSQAGLLGLIVPQEFGGMGGTLRDLAGACFAMGTACPSTALAYFFHCSSASRGLLGLEAIEAGLFSEDEAHLVQAFAHKLLNKMGREGKWLANFASEEAKSAASAVTISTIASRRRMGVERHEIFWVCQWRSRRIFGDSRARRRKHRRWFDIIFCAERCRGREHPRPMGCFGDAGDGDQRHYSQRCIRPR